LADASSKDFKELKAVVELELAKRYLANSNFTDKGYLRSVVTLFFRGQERPNDDPSADTAFYAHAYVENQFAASIGVTKNEWMKVHDKFISAQDGIGGDFSDTLKVSPSTVTRGSFFAFHLQLLLMPAIHFLRQSCLCASKARSARYWARRITS